MGCQSKVRPVMTRKLLSSDEAGEDAKLFILPHYSVVQPIKFRQGVRMSNNIK